MKLPIRPMLILGFAIASPVANAAQLIVIDARAAGIKAGQRLDSAKSITLKEGERSYRHWTQGQENHFAGKKVWEN